jgi:hypothetical protein
MESLKLSSRVKKNISADLSMLAWRKKQKRQNEVRTSIEDCLGTDGEVIKGGDSLVMLEDATAYISRINAERTVVAYSGLTPGKDANMQDAVKVMAGEETHFVYEHSGGISTLIANSENGTIVKEFLGLGYREGKKLHLSSSWRNGSASVGPKTYDPKQRKLVDSK